MTIAVFFTDFAASFRCLYLGLFPLPRMPVTSRIITRLVGDSYKHSFATITGKRYNPISTLKQVRKFVSQDFF